MNLNHYLEEQPTLGNFEDSLSHQTAIEIRILLKKWGELQIVLGSGKTYSLHSGDIGGFSSKSLWFKDEHNQYHGIPYDHIEQWYTHSAHSE